MRMRVLDQIRVLVEQDHIFRINHLFLFNASTFAFWQIVYFKLPVVGKELQNQFNSDSFRNSCTTLSFKNNMYNNKRISKFSLKYAERVR